MNYAYIKTLTWLKDEACNQLLDPVRKKEVQKNNRVKIQFSSNLGLTRGWNGSWGNGKQIRDLTFRLFISSHYVILQRELSQNGQNYHSKSSFHS